MYVCVCVCVYITGTDIEEILFLRVGFGKLFFKRWRLAAKKFVVSPECSL